MDGRDRTIGQFGSLLVRSFPVELRYLVERYQTDRRKQSISAAIIELIETHPAIAERAQRMYDSLE